MTRLRYGYNTNGFPHHRLEDALGILADAGYAGVALTLDVHHLDPFRSSARDVEEVGRALRRLNLEPVIETGARFLLDPRRKHEPSLLSAAPEERRRRLEFLERCARIGADLGARVLSLWSGRSPDGEDRGDLEGRLADGIRRVCDAVSNLGLTVALEPEPGMLVETLDDFARFRGACGRDDLGLCVDVGHLVCNGEGPVGARVREFAGTLRTAHLDDSPKGRHEHRMFGEGDLDLPDALSGFRAIGFPGLLSVELSRHGHEAPAAARRAIEVLRATETSLEPA